MKRFAVILVAAVLLLCSCASAGSDGSTVIRNKTDKFTPSGQKVESSIFGRNVKYDAYTPADGLALPIPSDEILDMVQIEKSLYFLTDGAVYTLDIESGASGKLFDTDAKMFYAHGGKLYTYAPETSKLSEYDTSGAVTKELTIEVTDVDSVLGLSITDDYYVFKCKIVGKTFIETYAFIYSRETEELVLSKKMPLSGIELYPYKGNKLLSITIDSIFGAPHLGIFEAESGKNETLQMLDSMIGNRPGVAYCQKTDTVLAYGGPIDTDFVYDGSAKENGDSPICIAEFSLDDTDKIVHDRYYLNISYETKFFISVYENIVSAVTSADNEYRVFDYLNPPESITFFGHSGIPDNVICRFEKDTGILIREIYTDYDKLALKLMAGDDDFDIFRPGSKYHNYADAGACVDLKEIESLNSRISGNAAADLIVSYDGKYIGVPVQLSNWCTEETWPEDGSDISYSLVISEYIYYARNVDVAEGRYSDPDGDELYKLFKFINDNPGGNRKKMPFKDDVALLYANVYMLNPRSQNRDSAIRFLEYLFDVYNGDIPGVVPEADLYPILESAENCYVEWRCRPLDIINPIFEARNAIHNQKDGFSNSELKKLAKETAAKVRMRMME